MADDLDEVVDMLRNLGGYFDKVGTAIESTKPGPKAIEEIAQKLGGDMGRMLDPPQTPLSPTMEAATDEAKNKTQTRLEKLATLMEKQLGDIVA